MKKTIKGFVAGFLVCSLLSSTIAFAASGIMKEIFYGINVVVDGKAVQFTDDTRPFIMDGRTFLSVRAIGEALGKAVDWDGTTQTVYIGQKNNASRFLDVVTAYVHSTLYWELVDEKQQGESCVVVGVQYKNAILYGGDETFALYNLNANYSTISAFVGMHDNYSTDASITFIGDGKELFTKIIKAYQNPEKIEVNVSGVSQLKVVKNEGGNGNVVCLINTTIK